jgi:hypothetical protein
MFPPLDELIVLMLLLFGVVGVYYLLKLHYIFAFNLVQNTSISDVKKQKIDKIKPYVFSFLKILLISSFVGMLYFSFFMWNEGGSLKDTLFKLWTSIPEGFWLFLLWTLLRIALLIVVMRYVLHYIYKFLDKQELKTIEKTRYNVDNVKMVYLRIHNSIKFTIVLGVMYRIVHFFPFLQEVSYVFLIALVVFVIMSLFIILREIRIMFITRK